MKKIITVKHEIKHLHSLLQHRNKWYVDIQCVDIPEFQDIAEKAKEIADYELSIMSVHALYNRYLKWEVSEKIIPPKADYYFSFLNDLVWDLGLSALEGREKDIYGDSINLKLYFI